MKLAVALALALAACTPVVADANRRLAQVGARLHTTDACTSCTAKWPCKLNQ